MSKTKVNKKAKLDKSKIPDDSILEVRKEGRFIKVFDADGNDLTSIVSSTTRSNAFNDNKNIMVKKSTDFYGKNRQKLIY